MKTLFEFAGSEISRMQSTPDALTVHFSAAMVRHQPNADKAYGRSAATDPLGYTSHLVLIAEHPHPTGDMTACLGLLTDGQVLQHGQRLTVLTVPSHLAGPLRLELQCGNGATFEIDAAGLRCMLGAGAQWQDTLQC